MSKKQAHVAGVQNEIAQLMATIMLYQHCTTLLEKTVFYRLTCVEENLRVNMNIKQTYNEMLRKFET